MKKQEISFYTHLVSVITSVFSFVVIFLIISGIDKWVYNLRFSRIEIGILAGLITALIVIFFVPSKKKQVGKMSRLPSSVAIITFLSIYFFTEVEDFLGFLLVFGILIVVIAINTLLYNRKQFLLHFKRSVFQSAITILFVMTVITLKENLLWLSGALIIVLIFDFFLESIKS